MAPNAGVPDPGQDNYAGTVEHELRDQAVRKVREEHRGDAGWSHDPDHQLDEAAAAKDAQRQADQFTAEQHDRLTHGLAMRGGPQVGDTNYLSIPHDRLHEMVNNDIDPATVDEAGSAWNEIGVTFGRIGDRLTTASAQIEHSWSGSAAEGARCFNAGVAGWSGSTARGALLSSNNMATQSDAAGTVKSAVPPPMQYSMWDEVTDLLSTPDPVSGANTVRAKLQQQQELHRQAADAVATYDRTLGSSSSTMPAFETPPAFGPNPHDQTGAPGGGNEPPPGRRTQVVPVGGPPPSSESPPPGGPDSGPPLEKNSAPNDPRVDQPGSTGTDPSWSGRGSSGHGRLAGTDIGVDGPGGLGSAGGRGLGDPGLGAAPVGGWGGGPGGGGRGHFGGPGVVRGVDGRVPGPGAGAPAAEQAALGRGAAGAAGARGSAGVGAMPVGAGGSGRGGEDEEHERPSYLLEENPNEVFGTDEAISPPVIE